MIPRVYNQRNLSLNCACSTTIVCTLMLPGEAENGVGMNRSVREGKKCKAL